MRLNVFPAALLVFLATSAWAGIIAPDGGHTRRQGRIDSALKVRDVFALSRLDPDNVLQSVHRTKINYFMGALFILHT